MNRIAEILVECGYAGGIASNFAYPNTVIQLQHHTEKVDPFTDTLEGRRQADALEDWLRIEHGELWQQSISGSGKMGCVVYILSEDARGSHHWRLDRIEYCIEQLEKADE